MNNELFQRRLSLVKASVLVLNPIIKKTHKDQIELAISKASPSNGLLIFNELEKLLINIAEQYEKNDVVTAILEVDK